MDTIMVVLRIGEVVEENIQVVNNVIEVDNFKKPKKLKVLGKNSSKKVKEKVFFIGVINFEKVGVLDHFKVDSNLVIG